MQVADELKIILDDVLSLGGRARGFDTDTALLGAIPELDSMAVVGLITAIEDRFGVEIADDEIDGSVFATFGSLLQFVGQMTSK
jgi:acyl carrier protein